jgi:hypothetical protein
VFTSPSSSHIALSSTSYFVSFTFDLTVFVISVLRMLSISTLRLSSSDSKYLSLSFMRVSS